MSEPWPCDEDDLPLPRNTVIEVDLFKDEWHECVYERKGVDGRHQVFLSDLDLTIHVAATR